MTIRKIINKAFRETGLIPVGGEAEAEEFQEGLDHLNSLFDTLFGNQLGEPLTDYFLDPIDTTEPLPSNFRLVLNTTTPASIKLVKTPQAGARLAIVDSQRVLATNPFTIDGNGRKIEGANTLLLNTTGLNRQWFYRDDRAEWVKVNDLLADDLVPFPPEFDDFLVTLLAFRISPRYGAQLSTSTVEVLKRLQSQFRARYRQTKEMPAERGIYRLPSTHYRQLTDNFDTGSTV